MKLGKSGQSLRFADVVREMPRAFLYFLIGSMSGIVFGFVLFSIDRNIFALLLNLWGRRLLFGAELIGGGYTYWFIVNNLFVMLVIIVASVFILVRVSREPPEFVKRYRRFKRFKNVERRRPKMTLLGLYIVPVGALAINGFLITMFATYVLLDYGFERFLSAVMLLMPHGINEIVALILACSLGLSYLKIMGPLILQGRPNAAIEVGKSLLKGRTTFYIVVLILTLVVFSGLVEGLLGTFVVG